MKVILAAISVLVSVSLFAQDTTTIFIPAGRDFSEVLVQSKIYKLPAFTNGSILYRDGTTSNGQLNYNFLNGEIEFVDPNDKILAIAENQMLNIRTVTIDTLTFFYDHRYLELVKKTALGTLAKSQVYMVTKRDKIGGYNQAAPTSGIDSYGSFTDNYGVLYEKLKVRENITLTLKSFYYFGDGFNVFLPASKKNLMNLYHSKRNELAAYLKANSVSFKNGNDLEKMFDSFR
ncbi:MAG: hypothetical protein JJE22_02975 [Bacteroidia bacterium]|nr:hypothetical protein [Bacteroidia bacterium]